MKSFFMFFVLFVMIAAMSVLAMLIPEEAVVFYPLQVFAGITVLSVLALVWRKMRAVERLS